MEVLILSLCFIFVLFICLDLGLFSKTIHLLERKFKSNEGWEINAFSPTEGNGPMSNANSQSVKVYCLAHIQNHSFAFFKFAITAWEFTVWQIALCKSPFNVTFFLSWNRNESPESCSNSNIAGRIWAGAESYSAARKNPPKLVPKWLSWLELPIWEYYLWSIANINLLLDLQKQDQQQKHNGKFYITNFLSLSCFHFKLSLKYCKCAASSIYFM